MEKNCTNCKYIIPVEGADYGFCNCEKHLGLKADGYTVCSEYEEAVVNELPKCKGCFMYDMIKQLEDDAYQSGFSEGCEYVTKIEELAAINEGLQKQVNELKAELGCYVVDQGIWLTANEGLEKENAKLKAENKELWDSYHKGYEVGYLYGKQDAVSADRAEPKKPRRKKKDDNQPLSGQLTIFEVMPELEVTDNVK